MKVDGWYSREDALKEIEDARERCRKHRAAPEGSEAADTNGGGDSLADSEPVESLSDHPDGPRDESADHEAADRL